jgi:drug/metabolite transporter (DMT)-like permease
MGVVYVLSAVVLWSFVPLVIKLVIGTFSPALIACSRFAAATVFLAATHHARSLRRPRARAGDERPLRWPGRRGWLLIGGLGIAGNYTLYALSLGFTTASAAALLVESSVIGLGILGPLVLKERVSAIRAMGMASAFAGVCIVAWNGQDVSALLRSEQFLGNLAAVAAGMCWSVFGMAQKVLSERLSVTESLTPLFFIAALASGALAAAGGHPWVSPSLVDVLWLIELGVIGTGLSYLLLGRGMQRMDASEVAVVASTLPLFVLVAAHLLLGEALTAHLLGGGALIMGGVALIIVDQRKRRAQVHGMISAS